MKGNFSGAWTEDALPAICALVLWVSIKTAIMRWYIKHMSIWRHTQQHNNYLEKELRASPPSAVVLCSSQLREGLGVGEYKCWVITLSIPCLLHHKINPGLIALGWSDGLPLVRLLHVPVPVLCVEMPSPSSFTESQGVCICFVSEVFPADIWIMPEWKWWNISPPLKVKLSGDNWESLLQIWPNSFYCQQ